MNRLIHLMLGLCALATTACTQFDREWRLWSGVSTKFPKHTEPAPTVQSPADGRWVGQWTSSRHKKLFSDEPAGGEVRLVLTKTDPYRYRANFRAFWLGFRGEYLTELYGRHKGKTFYFKGTENLKAGGDYHYEGTVTASQFTMEYNSRHDSGTVELSHMK